MNLIRKWKEYRAAKKEANEMEQFLIKLHSPYLFNQAQRDYLSALFPDHWCHIDNIPQETVFKIAFGMALFGYACSTHAEMKFCMYVLKLQNIYISENTNQLVIKRV